MHHATRATSLVFSIEPLRRAARTASLSLHAALFLFCILLAWPITNIFVYAQETAASFDELASQLDAELAKPRPDFVSIKQLLSDLNNIDASRASASYKAYMSRGKEVGREVAGAVQKNLSGGNFDVARKELDYCNSQRTVLGISFNTIVEWEDRYDQLRKGSKQAEQIESNIAQARQLLIENRTGEARGYLSMAQISLNDAKGGLAKERRDAYLREIDGYVRTIGSKEDSLIKVNLDILERRGKEAALEFRQHLIRTVRVSPERMNVLDEAISTADERMRARDDSIKAAQAEAQRLAEYERRRQEKLRAEEESRRQQEEAARLAREEQARIAAAKVAAEKARRDSLAAVKAEQQRLAEQEKQRREKERLEREESARQEKLKAEQAEKERRAEEVRRRQELAEQTARENAERERVAAEQRQAAAERERQAKTQKDRQVDAIKKDRIAAEQRQIAAEKERQAQRDRERAERERIAAEQRRVAEERERQARAEEARRVEQERQRQAAIEQAQHAEKKREQSRHDSIAMALSEQARVAGEERQRRREEMLRGSQAARTPPAPTAKSSAAGPPVVSAAKTKSASSASSSGGQMQAAQQYIIELYSLLERGKARQAYQGFVNGREFLQHNLDSDVFASIEQSVVDAYAEDQRVAAMQGSRLSDAGTLTEEQAPEQKYLSLIEQHLARNDAAEAYASFKRYKNELGRYLSRKELNALEQKVKLACKYAKCR